jgi:vacuolar protein-sorting-associated protein 4
VIVPVPLVGKYAGFLCCCCENTKSNGLREESSIRELFESQAVFEDRLVYCVEKMASDLVKQATDTVTLAIQADEDQKYAEAYNLYQRALEQFMVVLKYEKNPKMKEIIQKRVVGYMDRAEMLQKEISKPKETKKKATAVGKDEEDETGKLRGALQSAIVVEKPNIKWEDVAGLHQAKSMLKEAVILPQKFPQLFVGERKPWTGILLYGPPGTGKSFLAKAVATEADSTFFSVSSSDLVSKWQGESQRLVRQLFEMSREQAPAIVFIDEVDSLASSRSDGENAAQLQIKTEFLVQMDGVKKGDAHQRVLVLGATNTPWALDPAMRRRFEKRIYIPLPDEEARLEMFRLNIGKTPTNLNEADLKQLAKASKGFSGADISIVVRSALMEPLKTAQNAEYFSVDKDGMYSPIKTVDGQPPCDKCPMHLSTSKNAPQKCEKCGCYRMSLYDVEGSKLKVPDVTGDDVKNALSKGNPSVAQKELVRFEEWTKEFGQEG